MLPHRRRVWVVWGLVGGFVMSLVAAVAVVCWFQLPRWAPEWVIEHSPFLDRVIVASAGLHPLPPGTPEQNGGLPDRLVEDERMHRASRRLYDAGPAAVPALRRCLTSTAIDVRLLALSELGLRRALSIPEMLALSADADPWMRLSAWRVFMHASGAARREAAIHRGVELLGDPDAFIRAEVHEELQHEWSGQVSWSQTPTLCGLLAGRHGRTYAMRLLWQACRQRDDGPLPGDLLFPLLGACELRDGDPEIETLAAELLPRVIQDFDRLHTELTAMASGAQPWRFGAEPWMAALLAGLVERRMTLDVTSAPIGEVVASYLPSDMVHVDPRLIAAAPPVTLRLIDARASDLLKALAKATGARLRLSCGVAILGARDLDGFSGFAPLPTIREHAPGVALATLPERIAAALPRRLDLDADEVPLERILSDLSQRSGIPLGADRTLIRDQEDARQRPLTLHLRQAPLDHLLRLIAFDLAAEIEFDADGLRFAWPERREQP